MLLLVIVLKDAKPINLIFYCSISLLSRISWKRWVRTKVSKQCHNSCYFGCALHSRCSQLFSKPVALDRCCVSMGWFASVQLVSSPLVLKLLPLWPLHRIASIIVYCFPIHYGCHQTHCRCYPPLWTLLSMLEFALFPAVIMLIVVLGASKDASWKVIWKT